MKISRCEIKKGGVRASLYMKMGLCIYTAPFSYLSGEAKHQNSEF